MPSHPTRAFLESVIGKLSVIEGWCGDDDVGSDPDRRGARAQAYNSSKSDARTSFKANLKPEWRSVKCSLNPHRHLPGISARENVGGGCGLTAHVIRHCRRQQKNLGGCQVASVGGIYLHVGAQSAAAFKGKSGNE